MRKILLVHPSRGRPAQARRIFDNITKNLSGENSLDYIFALDSDDPTLEDYKKMDDPRISFVIGDNATSVVATNRAYSKELLAKYDMVGISSDDIFFPENWDKSLIEILDRVGYDKVIKTTNQYQGDPNLLNLQIGGFQFFLDYGTFYWPEYISMFADNDFTQFAIKNGRYVEARHLIFPHMQYSLSMPPDIIAKYGPMMPFDDTYNKENQGNAFAQGGALFSRRASEGFPAWHE
jgi:hypothetical protein